MAKRVDAATNEAQLLDSPMIQAQAADAIPWEALGIGSIVRQRIFTRGLPLGPQPQRQPEKRVEQGGPGDYITG